MTTHYNYAYACPIHRHIYGGLYWQHSSTLHNSFQTL